jgi:hypothetical protein
MDNYKLLTNINNNFSLGTIYNLLKWKYIHTPLFNC